MATLAGAILVLLGLSLAFLRANAYLAVGMNPQDGWDYCAPGTNRAVMECVERSAVPDFWPLALAGVMTAAGGLLLLASSPGPSWTFALTPAR
jgi:hypothetical protein